MSTLLELFTEFALLSFVAFGGATALLPELYRVVVENHRWMDATTFAHLYAIAQAAPGPNVLVVTLIGWQVAGLAGALTATVAMCLPMSVVVYLLFGHWDRFKGARWQRAIQLGVAPLAVGTDLLGGDAGRSIGRADGCGVGLRAGCCRLQREVEVSPAVVHCRRCGARAGGVCLTALDQISHHTPHTDIFPAFNSVHGCGGCRKIIPASCRERAPGSGHGHIFEGG
jgi:hypothetical protein